MNLKPVYDYIDSTIWKDNTSIFEVKRIAKCFCKSLSTLLTKKRLMHRLCGQSGSGKTTQLCESLLRCHNELKEQPLIIGVRTFASYHPNYESLLSRYGIKLIREKTNGFALKCLCAVMDIIFKKGYLIILDVTLLEPVFEEYIISLSIQYGYKSNYHILSVSKKISNLLIQRRAKQKLGAEAGRITLRTSSDYFYKILLIGLKFLKKAYPYLNTVVWTAFDLNPVFYGEIINCCDSVTKHRKIIKQFLYSEEDLLNHKMSFYMKFKTIFLY